TGTTPGLLIISNNRSTHAEHSANLKEDHLCEVDKGNGARHASESYRCSSASRSKEGIDGLAPARATGGDSPTCSESCACSCTDGSVSASCERAVSPQPLRERRVVMKRMLVDLY